nr:DUF368 domain-containing protein [Bacilli bacterium]
MKNIILIIKGFFMGLANLIPGVSGGTIAITLGIYDKLISSISHILSNIKENIKFLLPIFIGMILSILSLSKVMSFALDKFLFPTILFFIGAIVGGIPMLYKKVKGNKNISFYIIFILTFAFVIGMTYLSGGKVVSFDGMNIVGYIKLFFVGVISAATMVIPGISGSAVLMTLGYYEPVINTIKDLTNFSNLFSNMMILIPFGIGVIIGILLIAKLIEYLLKKYEVKTYYGILGFVFASIISIIIQNFFMNGIISVSILEIVLSIILFGLGFIIAYKLGDK